MIGSHLFPDACITHHSAFEVYGYGSQVFYECYVATKKRFRDFEYDGVTYRRIEPKTDMEVMLQTRLDKVFMPVYQKIMIGKEGVANVYQQEHRIKGRFT